MVEYTMNREINGKFETIKAGEATVMYGNKRRKWSSDRSEVERQK